MQLFRKSLISLYPAALIALALCILFPIGAGAAEKKKFVVVIDAGHGGTDHGAIENGINEKDVTLAVAKKLGALIDKKLKDTEVVYTRSTDQFISLQKRADIANAAKADLFVSIHCNSVDRNNKNRANVVGATTYVLGHHKDGDNLAVAQRENSVVELDSDDAAHFSSFDPSSVESNIIFQMTQKKNFQNSIRFATDVQREMSSIGRVSRGVQQAGFWVLWSTAAPAALVELDFLCNPEQARFLNSKEGQDKLAGAIFNAVKKYETYFKTSLGMASASEEAPAAQTAKKTDSAQKAAKKEDAQEPEPAPATETATASTASVSLPSSSETSERKKHRTEQPQAKKPSDGSHRRRSASARMEGASRIEQVQIAMTEEVTAYPLTDISASKIKETKKETKKEEPRQANKKDNKKKGESVSMPARRDRKNGRRNMKQSVKVDYRLLLFVSEDELAANDEAFKGLNPVAAFRENNQYKYTYGESADRGEMEVLLKEISALFPEARVIKCYY